MLASNSGHTEIVKYLTEEKASLDLQEYMVHKILMMANLYILKFSFDETLLILKYDQKQSYSQQTWLYI